MSQNQSHKQFRGVRSMKELPTESPSVTSFRRTYELSRSFELDDDLDFVPTLITESDVSILRSHASVPSSASSAWFGSVRLGRAAPRCAVLLRLFFLSFLRRPDS